MRIFGEISAATPLGCHNIRRERHIDHQRSADGWRGNPQSWGAVQSPFEILLITCIRSDTISISLNFVCSNVAQHVWLEFEDQLFTKWLPVHWLVAYHCRIDSSLSIIWVTSQWCLNIKKYIRYVLVYHQLCLSYIGHNCQIYPHFRMYISICAWMCLLFYISNQNKMQQSSLNWFLDAASYYIILFLNHRVCAPQIAQGYTMGKMVIIYMAGATSTYLFLTLRSDVI